MRTFLAPVLFVVITASVFALVGSESAPVAEASFHFVRIHRVMGGSDGDTTSQFVELRQASGGQNLVQNAQLCFYDQDGVPWARFVFPDEVDGANSNDSILVATAAMAAAWNAPGGATPDFIFDATNTTALALGADVNAPIPVPNGAIVYESKAVDTSCGSPEGNAIDMVGYGSGYNGITFFGDVIPTDLPTDGGGFQLTTTPVTFPPTDNSTEYELVDCIVARNNDGDAGTAGTACAPVSTPTPSPAATPSDTPAPTETAGPTATGEPTSTPASTDTPTPTDTPAPGQGLVWADIDCSTAVTPVDSLKVLRFDAGLGVAQASECPTPGGSVEVTIVSALIFPWGDADCSSAVDPVDSLKILRFDAGLSVSQSAGCPPIGSEVTVVEAS